MKEKESQQKKDICFYRLMLILSLMMHAVLLCFFIRIQLPVLYWFNLVSVLMYLLLIILVSRVHHIEYWLVALFLEVVIHVVLCNVYLGWGYGFSLYGLMLIPVTYYIAFSSPQVRQDILGSTLLAAADLVVIAISCVETGSINKYQGIGSEQMMWIFCINLILCVAAVMAYSAYFVNGMKHATLMLKERNEELDFMAHYDPITHMRNRHNMQEVFDEYENSGKKYCVVLGDLDDFKEKNDTYGHMCGDELLVNLSYLIRQEVRNRGEVCRWGGDEVLLLLKMDEWTGCQLTETICQKIRKFVLDYEGNKIQVTATFGFVFCDEAITMEKRISMADTRLYEGKKKGKNQVVR